MPLFEGEEHYKRLRPLKQTRLNLDGSKRSGTDSRFKLEDFYRKEEMMDKFQEIQKQKRLEGFVSPNVEENVDFEKAKQALNSPFHEQQKRTVQKINQELKLKSEMYDVIGDTREWGAENTYMIIDQNIKDFEQAQYIMALRGKATNQKAVVAFLEQKDGPSSLYSVNIKGYSMEELRESMDEFGLDYRTFVPRKGSIDVFVFDKDNQVGKNFIQFSNYYEQRPQIRKGIGDFVGDTSDNATRERAIKIYNKIIREYERRL